MLDPSTRSTVYYGGNLLNRSTDLAVSFTVVSPSLSNPASGTDPSYPFGTITTVAAARTNPNIIYAGTDDGWLWSSGMAARPGPASPVQFCPTGG